MNEMKYTRNEHPDTKAMLLYMKNNICLLLLKNGYNNNKKTQILFASLKLNGKSCLIFFFPVLVCAFRVLSYIFIKKRRIV